VLIATIKSEREAGCSPLSRAAEQPPLPKLAQAFHRIRQRRKLSGVSAAGHLRVALLNGAEYETAARALRVKDGVSQSKSTAFPGWQLSKTFDDRERAVLAYTDR